MTYTDGLEAALKHKHYWHAGQPPPTRRPYLGHCSAIFHESQYMLRHAAPIKRRFLEAGGYVTGVSNAKGYLKVVC